MKRKEQSAKHNSPPKSAEELYSKYKQKYKEGRS